MKINSYIAFFRALADPTKFRIIEALRNREKTVSGLQDELRLEQTRLSHSLRGLKEYGFVTSRREGKQQVYALQKDMAPLLRMMDTHVKRYYAHAKACGCVMGCGCIGRCMCRKRTRDGNVRA